ncbi:MAG: hypothetical protein ACODAF_07810 [Actinomycetota bacterium]
MNDTRGPASGPASEGQQVSEEEAREYVEKLREAPAEQIVTEMISILLNAAQVKLGRRDARLLIDLSSLVLDHVRQHVSADLATEVDQLLGQLRLNQVQAESDAAKRSLREANDLEQPPAAPSGQPPPQPASPQEQASKPASRLWVPGRDF